MNVLDTSIANVSIPAISGDLGVSPHQGTWVITSFAVANAISVPLTGWLTQRLGPGAAVRRLILLFVTGLVPVRRGAQHRIPDRRPRAAGRRGRADDPAVADAAAVELPGRQERHGAGVLGHDHAGGADHRSAARRLDHGQHSWPWIFYINIPVGIFAAWATWSIYHKRETAVQAAADRQGRAGAAGAVGRLAAAHARQGQGARLVQLD